MRTLRFLVFSTLSVATIGVFADEAPSSILSAASFLSSVDPHDDDAKDRIASKLRSKIEDHIEDKIKSKIQSRLADLAAADDVASAPPAIKSFGGSFAGVGSLPPVVSGAAMVSQLPNQLLPSHIAPVKHSAVYGQLNPKRRPSCAKIVSDVERATSTNRNTMGFGSFELIIDILSKNRDNRPPGEDLDDDDKAVDNAIEVIKSSASGPKSLSWTYLSSLRNCAVDEYGRTIFMKMVQLGLVQSLSNQGCGNLHGVSIVKLLDTLGNNILHLAVQSKNSYVVEYILGMIGADHALGILRHRNSDGLLPVDLAVSYELEDVTNMLKGKNKTLGRVAAMEIKKNHQSPAVLAAAAA